MNKNNEQTARILIGLVRYRILAERCGKESFEEAKLIRESILRVNKNLKVIFDDIDQKFAQIYCEPKKNAS